MVKPHHVLDEVRRRRGRSGDPRDPIRFYWVAIASADDGGDRNRFRQLLRDAAGDYQWVFDAVWHERRPVGAPRRADLPGHPCRSLGLLPRSGPSG